MVVMLVVCIRLALGRSIASGAQVAETRVLISAYCRHMKLAQENLGETKGYAVGSGRQERKVSSCMKRKLEVMETVLDWDVALPRTYLFP